jgi:hypothetical protein
VERLSQHATPIQDGVADFDLVFSKSRDLKKKSSLHTFLRNKQLKFSRSFLKKPILIRVNIFCKEEIVLKRENYFKSEKRHTCIGIEPYTLQLSHTYFTSALSELYDNLKYFNCQA